MAKKRKRPAVKHDAMKPANKPRVFAAVEAVGRCGVCQNTLYAHTTFCRLFDFDPSASGPTTCPLNGDEWALYQEQRSMAGRNFGTPGLRAGLRDK